MLLFRRLRVATRVATPAAAQAVDGQLIAVPDAKEENAAPTGSTDEEPDPNL